MLITYTANNNKINLDSFRHFNDKFEEVEVKEIDGKGFEKSNKIKQICRKAKQANSKPRST